MSKPNDVVRESAQPSQADIGSDLSVSLWQSMRNEGTIGTTANNRPDNFAITDNNHDATKADQKVLPALDIFDSQSPLPKAQFSEIAEQRNIDLKFQSVDSSFVGSDLYK